MKQLEGEMLLVKTEIESLSSDGETEIARDL